MSKQLFKAESKRLLEIMINSIYTHKEIFIRELISNASDAIDKSYFLSLRDESISFNKEDFYIEIIPNKEARTLTIIDKGIGMDKDELTDNLGTIAKSGSLAFKKENELENNMDIIGQFGVGFYSAFMVSSSVTVKSKKMGSNIAYEWSSTGQDTFEINECGMDGYGTEITLTIKPNTDDEKYDDYLENYKLTSLVKKYSDFIKYPIKMQVSKSRLKEKVNEDDKDEYEEYTEMETLNSMVPIWRKNKNELTDEDYTNFYHDKRYGFDEPLKAIHTSVEGNISYNSILYIPSTVPFDYYTKEYQKGLELYTNGVMIMEKCSDLLPDYFGFVKGVVDTADLSLNISRELLQHDVGLKFIAKKLKEKIKRELATMLSKDREKYEKFWDTFGRVIKYGLYSEYGMNKEFLQDLVMFKSSLESKLVTLEEYVERMQEDQKGIYYATGESVEKISKLPQTEMILDKGLEILYLTDDVDEFVVKMLMSYKEKEFISVSNASFDDEDNDKKDEKENIEDHNIFDFIKETLGDKVSDVKASKRLKSHPVCLSSNSDVSIEMEKVLSAMPNANGGAKAQKVLEINTSHSIYSIVKESFENDKDKLKAIANVLLNQALLIEGLPIDDPVEYANNVCLLIK